MNPLSEKSHDLQTFVGGLLFFILLGALLVPSAEAERLPGGDGLIISEIRIQGNNRIDADAILARIEIREKNLLIESQLTEDLKSIYQMGYFKDVEVSTAELESGIRVTFTVVEKPFLIDIQLAGNSKIDSLTLMDKVTLKEQDFVDPTRIKEDAERLRRHYEEAGYDETRVVPVLETIEEDQVSLTFFVEEGLSVKIREIRFEGREKMPESLIKDGVKTRPYFWATSWLTGSGIYMKEVVRQDAERIKELYLEEGFLQAQIGHPQIEHSEDRQWLILSFPVVEGERFTVRRIRFQGNTLLDDKALGHFMQLAEGDIFNGRLLHLDIAAMTDAYGQRGYIFARVVPNLDPDTEAQTVDLTFVVQEGGPVHVRHVTILGNDKTRDKVIRREIRVNEEEVINTQALRRSFQRLNNLNFFETVSIIPEQINPTLVDLLVRVQEKPTGSFSIGGGYSSVDGLVALIEVTQGNLMGRGHLLRGRFETGGQRTTYNLKFREPYLLDYPLAMTTDLFNQERDYQSFREDLSGADLVFSKEFSEYLSGSFGASIENRRVFGADCPDNAAKLICDQQELGETETNSLSFSLARDTRDYFFDPSQGYRHAVSYEFAGSFLGGSTDFYKVVWDAKHYFPMWWNTVFALHGRVGYLQAVDGGNVPQGERFFVGGMNSVRGFEYAWAGPVEDGDIIGGDKELVFNLEYIFPIVEEARLKGVVFFDAGRGFNDDESIRLDELRTGAGFGIRLLLPIGPIRLEWGKNLNPKPGEKTEFIPEFSIGTLF